MKQITACRVCGSAALEPILDFGNPYISDFLAAGQEGTRAPLAVVLCLTCGLAQLDHTVDPALLYRSAYWYRSGTNESMRAALREVADIAPAQLGEGDRVLDIGANDGTLLGYYPDFVERVAVEPCGLFADALDSHADEIVRDLWPCPVDGTFKRITSIACFYDADDPHAWVEAIKQALAPGGLWVCQFQDADSVLRTNAFDYWCHEHLTLWSAQRFAALCYAHGLALVSAQANDVNGGSMRFVVRHAGPQDRLQVLPESRLDEWREWAKRCEDMRQAGTDLLHNLTHGLNRILGVAASTKFNTVLQWYGITGTVVPLILERAPEKFGRRTPGSNIPIIDEADAPRADFYLAGAWQFLDGLRQRSPDVPFLTLLPDVTIYPALREATHALAG